MESEDYSRRKIGEVKGKQGIVGVPRPERTERCTTLTSSGPFSNNLLGI